MAERSHLSIGEVLSLLRDEFPDVTISKIRFLESQGLVDPERTPSGYRKFYEHDVDRLRWILQQQREKFLPLKVIRGKLNERDDAAGVESPTGATAANSNEARATEPNQASEANSHDAAANSHGGSGVDAEAHAAVNAGQDRSEQSRRPDQGQPGGALQSASASSGAARPALAQPAQPAGPLTSSSRVTSPQTLGRVAGAAADEASSRDLAAGSAGAAAGIGSSSEPRAADELTRRSPASSGTPRVERNAEPSPRVSEGERAGVGQPGGAEETLTVDELARASGLEPEAVRELEQYGLVHGQMVGRTSYYDREALAVTRVAAAFARHGIGARHLRAYRNSAEREAGLFEAVVLPLVRQRNPASRQAAAQTIEELCSLGADLRALLIRQALGELR